MNSYDRTVTASTKIHCSLKMGGLLFLSIPVCVDSLHYPIKRCYGRIRLPFIFQGIKTFRFASFSNSSNHLSNG
ncbi:unnamed protein product, partial [Thelazia callipaeda]|uniref:Secreted protein n=1 Tax=Thelazia callipaeda TaxID=103827 RepID=A0A0N5CTV1_THECL